MAANARAFLATPSFSPVRQGALVILDSRALQRRLESNRRDADGDSARTFDRAAAAARVSAFAPLPPKTTSSAPAATPDRSFDVLALVREQQGFHAGLLAEQLERAIDALLECKLVGKAGDLAAKRGALFDLYDAGIVTKAQVRRRGLLEPAQFHEELRSHRMRTGPR